MLNTNTHKSTGFRHILRMWTSSWVGGCGELVRRGDSEALLAAARVLRSEGPMLSRPFVDAMSHCVVIRT